MNIDWRLKLFQILDAIGMEEGVIFEKTWVLTGITPEEREEILLQYNEHVLKTFPRDPTWENN